MIDTRPRVRPILLAAAAAVVTMACSSKDPILLYSITFGFGDLPPPDRTLPYNLGLEPFRAVSEVQNVNLLSRREDERGRYQTYVVTQLWSTLPANQATQAARTYFADRFANVERYPGSYVADCVLRAELSHFEEIRGKDGNKAVVGLRYSLFMRGNLGGDSVSGDLVYRPLSNAERGTRNAERGAGYEFEAHAEEPFEPSRGLEDGSALAVALRGAMEKALEQVWRKILEHESEFPSAPGRFLGP